MLINPKTETGKWNKITLDSTKYSCIESISAGDVNGDGWDDVVLANRQPWIQSCLYWYANPKGSGTWTRHRIDILSTKHLRGRPPIVADVNRDGKLDVTCYHHDDKVTYWYENDGTGTAWVKHRK